MYTNNNDKKTALCSQHEQELSAAVSCHATRFTWHCCIIQKLTHTHTRSPKKESDSCGCFTPVGDIMWLCSFIAYALTLPFKQKIMPVSYANAVLSLHTRVLPGVLVTCASSNKKVSAPLDNHHRGFVFAPVATLAGPLASHTVRAVLIPAPCLPVCLQI